MLALVRDSSNLSKLSGLNKVQIIKCAPSAWPKFISKSNPDVLILNDWSGVANRYRNLPEQFENVDRIVQMVDSALNAGVKNVIGVGSQAELGPVESQITESMPDNPTSLYGEAKIQTRRTMQELVQASEARFVWMRIFSTYGPLDEGSWLIPEIVDSLIANRSVRMTKGEQQWSYLHAYDLANAFAKVISETSIDGIVNVGNPQTISIHEVGSTIGKILDREHLIDFGALAYRIDQVMRLQPKCETLIKSGWYPEIPFLDGIKQTIDWLQRKSLTNIITKNGTPLIFDLPERP